MGKIAPEQKSSKEFVFSGEILLDASNPTPVTTPFKVITSAHVSLKTAVAPGVVTSVVTYSTTGGVLNIYAWKVTGTTDTTLIASTEVADTVGYIVTGY